ncbi:hypothetical protein GIB67_032074 [Kingdonia uniflora]|uniref:Uncharacterized protein n=1 Tax=Kingdonia uniflora TaxID=39325 RepID=A0A7J7MWP7_9MAGN|nr:hypothetical protein GIB67_032074 [Kingdonia uniflora]
MSKSSLKIMFKAAMYKDDYGLEVSVGLPQAASHPIPAKTIETVSEDDLSRHLAELKSKGYVQAHNISPNFKGGGQTLRNEGHLEIKVTKVEERYFGHLSIADVLSPRGPLDITGMSPEQIKVEADCWFWNNIFADEVSEINHPRAVLRYIAEDEIRQEDVLAAGGEGKSEGVREEACKANKKKSLNEIYVLIERAKVVKEKDLQAVRLQELLNGDVLEYGSSNKIVGMELGRKYRVRNNGGDGVGEFGGTRVANEVASCFDTMRREVDKERTEIDIDHELQISGCKYFADQLLMLGNYEFYPKDPGEPLKWKHFHFALKGVNKNWKEAVEELFKEARLKRSQTKGDDISLIDGKMSAKTNGVVDSSIPIENPDLSGYTIDSDAAKREA